MPKKPAAHEAKREAHNESSSERGRPEKQGQQRGRQEGNSGAHQGGHEEVSDYRQGIREKKMTEANKSKDGCLPKLFMLLLPFMAAGAYLMLRS